MHIYIYIYIYRASVPNIAMSLISPPPEVFSLYRRFCCHGNILRLKKSKLEACSPRDFLLWFRVETRNYTNTKLFH